MTDIWEILCVRMWSRLIWLSTALCENGNETIVPEKAGNSRGTEGHINKTKTEVKCAYKLRCMFPVRTFLKICEVF